MPTKLIRRDKTGSDKISTRITGPYLALVDGVSGNVQTPGFTEAKIAEQADNGTDSYVIRWVSSADIVPGQQYVLHWTIQGKVGDEVEYFIDHGTTVGVVKWKSIAKDKIPPSGTRPGDSTATQSGAIWRSNIAFTG